MSQLELVTESIRAALAASEASSNALRAVLRLLGEEASPAPVETVEAPESVDEASCGHANAVKAATGAGEFLICECGWQQSIS